jgi:hypothetical protein
MERIGETRVIVVFDVIIEIIDAATFELLQLPGGVRVESGSVGNYSIESRLTSLRHLHYCIRPRLKLIASKAAEREQSWCRDDLMSLEANLGSNIQDRVTATLEFDNSSDETRRFEYEFVVLGSTEGTDLQFNALEESIVNVWNSPDCERVRRQHDPPTVPSGTPKTTDVHPSMLDGDVRSDERPKVTLGIVLIRRYEALAVYQPRCEKRLIQFSLIVVARHWL